MTKEKKTVSLSVDEAIRCIRVFYDDTVEDEHGRYRSWQHCYNAFISNRGKTDDSTIDHLALHLAFYLASWGMYRGSSFLLQKDYRVHVPIVKIILEDRYNSLAGISAEDLMSDENLMLLVELGNRIRNVYAEERPAFEGVINHTTDTLATKILLGTLGCVPAYDRYYIQSVKKYGISSGVFNKKSVKAVAEYYLSHKGEFEKVRLEMSSADIEYPPMKLIDMCMWQIAFEASKR